MTISYQSPEAVVAHIQSQNRVFIQGSAATPVRLIKALFTQKDRLKDVELVSITLQGIDFPVQELKDHFFINSLFVSNGVREMVNSPYGDYVPTFLSEIPMLFRRNILPLDVAMIQVSPPDKNGLCSLGTSVDIARAAVDTAKIVIAQVNPRVPRTHGDSFIHISKIYAACWVDEPLPEVNYGDGNHEVTDKIGEIVAGLVEDGATLQMGIGNIPDAVLKNLHHHKNLGIHTEMFSDGVIPLLEKGVINNSQKKLLNGHSVTTFIVGSQKLYDFVDDNPMINFLDVSYVNDPRTLCLNPKVTAINSAIEIDLSGQVCADSMGSYQYSGIGGQMDFIRGAALSEGGKPIIAMPSTTGKGLSKIVPFLKHGAGVVTTRGHIHWVVTEYGAVFLFGLNMKQRAKALISIAHPNHREALEREWFERFKNL
jgi:acyl-CoA hydrolase